MAELGLFIGALVAVYLVPGPDMLLVLQTSSSQGRKTALLTAMGLCIARAMHVTLAAVGLATLLKTVPWAFEAMRIIGAAYLIWLGIKIVRTSSLVPKLSPSPSATLASTHRTAVLRGILTNVINPKALLFCSVLLPQFVHADAGNVAGQFLLLGIVLVALGFLFDVCYALTGAALGYWMEHNPTIQVIQRWTFAALLIGFGLRLAVDGPARNQGG